MACDEDEEIQLQDKMNWIFYNTTADLSEAPEGIREFLNYVENETVDDDFTKLLDRRNPKQPSRRRTRDRMISR